MNSIVLLIGVGLRSQNLNQFLIVGAEVVVGTLLLLWSISSLLSEGCWNKLVGLWWGIVVAVLAFSVGGFLITGDYERYAIRVATVTPAAPGQSTATSTATPTPQPPSTPMPVSTPPVSALELGDWSWLAVAEVPSQQIIEALNRIWDAPAQNAAQMTAQLRAVRETASDEGKRVGGLLAAVALERATDLNAARAAYQESVNEAAGTAYATSAGFRLRLLGEPEPDISNAAAPNFFQRLLQRPTGAAGQRPKDIQMIYTAIAAEPEVAGWFLIAGRWIWSTTRRAALQALVELRSDQLSFRFFQFLRSRSLFPASYSYLFILLVLTIGVKLLALPLYARMAKLTVQTRRLRPEIRAIRSMYGDNPLVQQQQLAQLYQEHGLNMWGGCAVFVVDLIFVIWALVSLNSFSPQLTLDGASFLWIADVTQRDLWILVAWAALSLIQYALSGAAQQTGLSTTQMSCSMLIGSALIVGIAWYGKWPAYILIFWLLLTLVGVLINGILTTIWSITESR